MKAAEEAEPRAQPELVHGCPAGLHGECPDRHTGDDIDKSLPGTPSCRVLRVRQYGPRDRLLPCRWVLALLRSFTQGVRRVLGEM